MSSAATEEKRATPGGTAAPEASAVIWNWRGESSEAPAGEGRERLFGLLHSLGVGVFGLAIHFLVSVTIARVVFTVASVMLVAALVSPTGVYAGIRALLRRLGHWTGIGLAWLLLVPIFYLAFAPFGLLLRRGRRDRLRRRLDPEAPSHWEPHEGPTAASDSMQRQY